MTDAHEEGWSARATERVDQLSEKLAEARLNDDPIPYGDITDLIDALVADRTDQLVRGTELSVKQAEAKIERAKADQAQAKYSRGRVFTEDIASQMGWGFVALIVVSIIAGTIIYLSTRPSDPKDISDDRLQLACIQSGGTWASTNPTDSGDLTCIR